MGEFGLYIFLTVLILKGLIIICKDFGEIYTPGWYGGGGYPPQGSGIRDQGSVKARSEA